MRKQVIKITGRCNYQCFYCREYCSDRPDLSMEEVVLQCQDAVNRGICEIQLGGGEPLLYPNLEKLVSLVKQVPGVCRVSIATNGSLLQERVKSLKEAGLDEIDLHMDVPEAVAYTEITGKSQILNHVLGVIWSSDVSDGLSLVISVYLHEKSKPYLAVMAAIAKRFDIVVRFVEIEEYSKASGLSESEVMRRIGRNIKDLKMDGEHVYTSPELKGRLVFEKM